MCHFWYLCQWPCFLPKYGNVENQAVSQKPHSVKQKQAQCRTHAVQREYMCNFNNCTSFSLLYQTGMQMLNLPTNSVFQLLWYFYAVNCVTFALPCVAILSVNATFALNVYAMILTSNDTSHRVLPIWVICAIPYVLNGLGVCSPLCLYYPQTNKFPSIGTDPVVSYS